MTQSIRIRSSRFFRCSRSFHFFLVFSSVCLPFRLLSSSSSSAQCALIHGSVNTDTPHIPTTYEYMYARTRPVPMLPLSRCDRFCGYWSLPISRILRVNRTISQVWFDRANLTAMRFAERNESVRKWAIGVGGWMGAWVACCGIFFLLLLWEE